MSLVWRSGNGCWFSVFATVGLVVGIACFGDFSRGSSLVFGLGG